MAGHLSISRHLSDALTLTCFTVCSRQKKWSSVGGMRCGVKEEVFFIIFFFFLNNLLRVLEFVSLLLVFTMLRNR